FYEASARVPLIYKPSKHHGIPLSAGSVCQQPVLLADLYPTFTELAGCHVASDRDKREGQSLIDSMTGNHEGRHLFGYIQDEGGLYMVTDGEWKYVYYDQDQREQLFNLKEDPQERHDLIAEAGTAESLLL